MSERSTSAGPGAWIARLVPPILAIAGTASMSRLVETHTASASLLHRMLAPEGGVFTQLVPTGVVFLLIWTLADLVIKLLRVLRDGALLSGSTVSGLPMRVAQAGPTAGRNAIDALGRSARNRGIIAPHRALLDLLATPGGGRGAHEAFRHQSELRADADASGFATARVFIWAMPILGFIGTVLGIGSAIGEFSVFLTGDIEDVELVKSELANVAGGLSYAFDTTLLGLLGALPAMLVMAFVQKSEEGLGARADNLGLAILANAAASGAADADDQATPELLRTVAERLNALDGRWTGLSDSLRGLLESLTPLTTHTAELAGGVGQAAASAATIAERLREIEAGVGTTPTRIENALGPLEETISRLSDRVGELSSDARDSRNLAELVASLTEQLDRFHGVVADFRGPLELRLVKADGAGAS